MNNYVSGRINLESIRHRQSASDRAAILQETLNFIYGEFPSPTSTQQNAFCLEDGKHHNFFEAHCNVGSLETSLEKFTENKYGSSSKEFIANRNKFLPFYKFMDGINEKLNKDEQAGILKKMCNVLLYTLEPENHTRETSDIKQNGERFGKLSDEQKAKFLNPKTVDDLIAFDKAMNVPAVQTANSVLNVEKINRSDSDVVLNQATKLNNVRNPEIQTGTNLIWFNGGFVSNIDRKDSDVVLNQAMKSKNVSNLEVIQEHKPETIKKDNSSKGNLWFGGRFIH